MTQGELVFQAVSEVFGDVDRVPSTTEWTKEQLEAVHSRVLLGFINGDVTKQRGGVDEIALRKYIPGLVNNWVRKDKRLNGGQAYIPKNPGSRSGSGDETLKNLKLLLTMVADDVKPAVQVEIDKRLEELKPKAQVLNVDALPADLRVKLAKFMPNLVRKPSGK